MVTHFELHQSQMNFFKYLMVERTSAEIKSFPAHKIGNATEPSRTIQVSCEFKNIYKGHTRADIAFTNTQYSR